MLLIVFLISLQRIISLLGYCCYAGVLPYKKEEIPLPNEAMQTVYHERRMWDYARNDYEPVASNRQHNNMTRFCPSVKEARDCILNCMQHAKPAYCGRDHKCYCGHKDKNTVNKLRKQDAKEKHGDFYFSEKDTMPLPNESVKTQLNSIHVASQDAAERMTEKEKDMENSGEGTQEGGNNGTDGETGTKGLTENYNQVTGVYVDKVSEDAEESDEEGAEVSESIGDSKQEVTKDGVVMESPKEESVENVDVTKSSGEKATNNETAKWSKEDENGEVLKVLKDAKASTEEISEESKQDVSETSKKQVTEAPKKEAVAGSKDKAAKIDQVSDDDKIIEVSEEDIVWDNVASDGSKDYDVEDSEAVKEGEATKAPIYNETMKESNDSGEGGATKEEDSSQENETATEDESTNNAVYH